MSTRLALFLLTLATFTAGAQSLRLERESFPHSPEDVEHHADRYTEPSLIPAKSVAAQKQQASWLRRELSRFPPSETQTSPPREAFGYLSARHPVSIPDADFEEWIKLQLHTDLSLSIEAIALVPACYPAFSLKHHYGFPRRFKIEVFSAEAPEQAVTVVDWTQQDFPDPGLSPVIFTMPAMKVQNIILTVTRGALDGETQFFALDELMVFRAGNNIGLPSKHSLTASSSTELDTFWSLNYLVDRKQHLGKFQHAAQQTPDFIRYFPKNSEITEPPEILIDLGQSESLGRVELYAATLPELPIPALAMPTTYRIDLLNHLGEGGLIKSTTIQAPLIQKMRWHPLYSHNARYLRITTTELPQYRGRPILALGEIRVLGDEGPNRVNLAKGKSIKLTHAPSNSLGSDPRLLVDGLTNGREIVPEKQYIEQLAKRQLIENAMANVEKSLVVAQITRTQRYWTLGITAATIILFAILLWIIHLRSSKNRAVREVQKQISADLHDDISGNLGTISMISSRLQNQADPDLTQEKLREIRHLAQESFVSLKEIIWHTETGVIRISDLLEQIKRTSQSILSECRVSYDFPSEYENSIVPVATRRNITLLVKETLYNCSKYAKATTMVIRAEIIDSQLQISMRDDGCGFDPHCETSANSGSGRGLSNMEQRAKLLGAELIVQSAPNEGTCVILSTPIHHSSHA